MTQNEIQKKHDEAAIFISFYASGLITLPEFTGAITRIHSALGAVNGLIDPATGLRM